MRNYFQTRLFTFLPSVCRFLLPQFADLQKYQKGSLVAGGRNLFLFIHRVLLSFSTPRKQRYDRSLECWSIYKTWEKSFLQLKIVFIPVTIHLVTRAFQTCMKPTTILSI